MPLPLQHFYMIRHGETEANAARIMAGSLDSPLTDKGRAQAHNTREIVNKLEIKPQAIFHSHLTRARETAQILNHTLNAPMFEDPDFAELHAGDWEGVPYDKCPELLDSWADPPNGETFEEFFIRIRRGKTNAFQKENQPVMIVCHGGVFRAFGKLYGIDSYGVDNCTLYEFKPDPSKTHFPWDVWEYRIDAEVIKKPAMIYSASPADVDKIAS